MGGGRHGGFGHTIGSRTSLGFTAVRIKATVKVEGIARDVSRKVYQRNDIDFGLVTKNGKTNLDRMKAGKPPIGNDGRPVQLHHVIQKECGPLVEVREGTHRLYYKTLHGLSGKHLSFRNDPVLKKQYNNFRRLYWKQRARDYEGKKDR